MIFLSHCFNLKSSIKYSDNNFLHIFTHQFLRDLLSGEAERRLICKRVSTVASMMFFFLIFKFAVSLKIFLEPWESEGSLGLVELVRARRSFKAEIKAPHSAKHWRHERDLYDFKLSNLNHELWIIRGQASTQISDPSHKNVLVCHKDWKTICRGRFYFFQSQNNN